jgi:hypothetical protein
MTIDNQIPEEPEVSEAALDARARRAARRVGLKAIKTRWRANSIDNYGGFSIIDPNRNLIVASEKFTMSADEVIDYCEGLNEEH